MASPDRNPVSRIRYWHASVHSINPFPGFGIDASALCRYFSSKASREPLPMNFPEEEDHFHNAIDPSLYLFLLAFCLQNWTAVLVRFSEFTSSGATIAFDSTCQYEPGRYSRRYLNAVAQTPGLWTQHRPIGTGAWRILSLGDGSRSNASAQWHFILAALSF